MKTKIILGLLMLTTAAQGADLRDSYKNRNLDRNQMSRFRGSEGVGGGDICESQIKVIRDDIASWILQGGPNSLQLPAGMTVASYSEGMLKQIGKAKFRCVSKGDDGFPVQVYGTPKICQFKKSLTGNSRITCDRDKFMKLDENERYVLTHHEYAGLAEIEVPNRDDSTYSLSNQISSYLVDTVVKRLAVKPVVRTSGSNISPDQLQLYIERFTNIIHWHAFSRNCKITKGSFATAQIARNKQEADWISNESTEQTVMTKVVEKLEGATSGRIDTSSSAPRIIFDLIENSSFTKEGREIQHKSGYEIIVTLTPNSQAIAALKYSESFFKTDMISGNLLNPVRAGQWVTGGVYECKK